MVHNLDPFHTDVAALFVLLKTQKTDQLSSRTC
jgi:hypothetical protein